ncbi:MAG: SDR family oxidoreductase [Nitrospira sp.]
MRGIGEAIAKRFADEASVVITGRRQQELDHVVNVIRLHKGNRTWCGGSVTDEAHVRISSVARSIVLEKLMCSSIMLVSVFGKRTHETDDATWADVLDVNVTGVFGLMTRAVFLRCRSRGAGPLSIFPQLPV